MADPTIIFNETIESIPVISLVYTGLNFVKVLAGGIFGLALLNFIVNILFRSKEIRLLKELNAKIDSLAKRVDAPEKKRRK